jgi:hypothetical protein
VAIRTKAIKKDLAYLSPTLQRIDHKQQRQQQRQEQQRKENNALKRTTLVLIEFN